MKKLPFIISLLLAVYLQGQNTRELIFEEADTLTRLRIFVQNPKDIKNDAEKMYHWHHQNTVSATEGSWSGLLLQGSYEVFYPNKNLYKQGWFEKGLREGTWKEWHSNGILKKEEHWKKGLREGDTKEYNAAGQLQKEGKYKKGKLQGSLTFYSEDGRKVGSEKYKNGKLVKPMVAKTQKTRPEAKKEKESTDIKKVAKEKSATDKQKNAAENKALPTEKQKTKALESGKNTNPDSKTPKNKKEAEKTSR